MEVFGIVVFGVVAVAVVLGFVSLIGRDATYDQIGRGGIGDEREAGPREVAGPSSVVDARERDEEIRQMLEARSARRVAKGQPPLDVDAEVAALTAPAAPVVDRALLLEIRELVEARNARRVRRGQEPLDVDAEVERQVRDLAG